MKCKTLIIFLLLTLVSKYCFAPNISTEEFYLGWNKYFEYKQSQLLIQQKKVILWHTIKYIESRFKSKEFNEFEDAAGISQIRPIMLKEVNRILGYEKYKLEDRFDAKKSEEMFWVFQEKYNPNFDFNLGCHIWNAGACTISKRWKYTEGYRAIANNYVENIFK